MLVSNIAAVRDAVVVVARSFPQTQPSGQTGLGVDILGTACYVGSDFFLTASHIFPDTKPQQSIVLISVANTGAATVLHGNATIDFTLPFVASGPDLAILKAPGVATSVPAMVVDCRDVADGESVFSYGYPDSTVSSMPTGLLFSLMARACLSIISAHTLAPERKYLLDGSTYPGESGAPVFRRSDNAVVAIVQATKTIQTPPPNLLVRGPTVAGPLAPIAAELAARGIPLLS